MRENGKIVWALKLFLFLATGVSVLFVAGKIWRALEEKSLAKADQLGLTATYDRWAEAGRPEGEALAEFMKGRNSYAVSNCSFTIGGTNYRTEFVVRTNMSGWAGTLFVTTNRALIWLGDSGQPQLILRK